MPKSRHSNQHKKTVHFLLGNFYQKKKRNFATNNSFKQYNNVPETFSYLLLYFQHDEKKEILRIALNFAVYFAHKHCKLTLISMFLCVVQEQKE